MRKTKWWGGLYAALWLVVLMSGCGSDYTNADMNSTASTVKTVSTTETTTTTNTELNGSSQLPSTTVATQSQVQSTEMTKQQTTRQTSSVSTTTASIQSLLTTSTTISVRPPGGITIDVFRPGYFGHAPADSRRAEFDADNERIIRSQKKVAIVFIGDSITEGWNVRGAFRDFGQVVNRGISGDIIDVIEKRFAADVLQLHPKVVVVHGGVNNTFPFFSTPEDELPQAIEQAVNTYVESYEKIFRACQESGQKVVACAITPLAESPSIGATARKETVVRMNEELRRLCEKYGVVYVDYHTALVGKDGKTAKPGVTGDGLHPNGNGYALMESVLRPILLEAFGKT